jgi:hypothetical protein
MIPATKHFDSFLKIFKQVPMLPQVFTFERIREIITWKDNRKSGEVFTLTESEETILKKSAYEIILEAEPEMSRLVYEEIERNIINDFSEVQLKRYLALLKDKVYYHISQLKHYNYIDVLFDPAFSHVSPHLFHDYLEALRTTFFIFQALEEYLIEKQRAYGFLSSFRGNSINISEEEYIPNNSSLNLKSQFINPDKYDDVIERLYNEGRVLKQNGELIFIPKRKGTKYEPEALRQALNILNFLDSKKNLSNFEILTMLSNTFINYKATDRTLRSSSIPDSVKYYRSILS